MAGLQVRDQGIDKFARSWGFEQRRSDRVISHQPHQCANANQIIVHQAFRHADHKNQVSTHCILAKGNASATTSHPKNDFIDQIRARMGKRSAIFHHAEMRLLAGEDLFEKSFCVIDLSILREQTDNLAQRIRQFPGAQSEDHLLFMEKVSQRDSHSNQRDLLDYPGKASYPIDCQDNWSPGDLVTCRKSWQLKIQHWLKTRKGQSPSNAAFTTRAMSMRCRIFIAAR